MNGQSAGRGESPNPVGMESQSTRFITGLPWFDALVPEGVPVPSSILVSGPSGTGKPFVGLALAASWLRQGGQVIFVPLHSTHPALFEKGLRDLLNLDLRDFAGSHFFILFDTDLDPHKSAVEAAGHNALRANLVNPRAWREAVAAASAVLDGGGPTLVFASALNLLLFSPTYGDQMYSMLLETIRNTGSWTYLLALSSSILLRKGIVLEHAADHLFVMERVPRQRYVHLRAARVRNAAFRAEAVRAPVQADFLEDLKNEAVASRRILIPLVSRI
jgi:KaiC/GvpD/RAD55 family RecA-like ATPase